MRAKQHTCLSFCSRNTEGQSGVVFFSFRLLCVTQSAVSHLPAVHACKREPNGDTGHTLQRSQPSKGVKLHFTQQPLYCLSALCCVSEGKTPNIHCFLKLLSVFYLTKSADRTNTEESLTPHPPVDIGVCSSLRLLLLEIESRVMNIQILSFNHHSRVTFSFLFLLNLFTVKQPLTRLACPLF